MRALRVIIGLVIIVGLQVAIFAGLVWVAAQVIKSVWS